MANLSENDPKVIELSYDLLEKIIMAIDYKSKDDLVKLSKIMVEKFNSDDKYPQLLKLAYADAQNKIDLLSFDQINEIKSIITTNE